MIRDLYLGPELGSGVFSKPKSESNGNERMNAILEATRRMPHLERLEMQTFFEHDTVNLIQALLSSNDSHSNVRDGCGRVCMVLSRLDFLICQFPKPSSAGQRKLCSLLEQQRKSGLEPACRIVTIRCLLCSHFDDEIAKLLQELLGANIDNIQ